MSEEYGVELHIPTLLLALAQHYHAEETFEQGSISTLDVEDYLEKTWKALVDNKTFNEQTIFIEDSTVDEVGPGGMRMVGGMFELSHIPALKNWVGMFRVWLDKIIDQNQSLGLLRKTLGDNWYESNILGSTINVGKVGQKTAAEMILLKVSDGLEDFEQTLQTLL